RHVLTVNSNETAIVWNVATGDTARVLSNNYLKKQIINARYSPDGASLLLESYDTKNPKKNFLLTDTTGNTQDTLWGETGYPFEVAFTPDGSSLAISKGKFVYLKDIK